MVRESTTVLGGTNMGVVDVRVVTGDICDHDIFTYSIGVVLAGTTTGGATKVCFSAPVSGWHWGHTNLSFSLVDSIPMQAG